MSIIEIVLLVFGAIIFIGSFLIPSKEKKSSAPQVDEETIRKMVDKEVESAKSQINDIVDETITYAMEKTERSMDRLTNEKMMAVNEYSDTVLGEIDKNHKEVVFLYDMLNDKHENLKNTVSEAEKKASEVKQTVKDAEITAKEAEEKAKVAMESVEAGKQAETTENFVPFIPQSIELPKEEPKPERKKRAAKPKVEEAEAEELTENSESFTDLGNSGRLIDSENAANSGNMGNSGVLESANVISKNTNTASQSAKAGKTDAAEVPDVTVSLDQVGRTGGRNSNERILELHKAGKSNMAIAKELGLGIGEVKLVIDLFEGM